MCSADLNSCVTVKKKGFSPLFYPRGQFKFQYFFHKQYVIYNIILDSTAMLVTVSTTL